MLDFYLRHSQFIPSKTSKEILDLSKFLIQLTRTDSPHKRGHYGEQVK